MAMCLLAVGQTVIFEDVAEVLERHVDFHLPRWALSVKMILFWNPASDEFVQDAVGKVSALSVFVRLQLLSQLDFVSVKL